MAAININVSYHPDNTVFDIMPSDRCRCDYLDQHRPPQASDFINGRAELAHIKRKICSLDQHMSQLTTLRHDLLVHSRRLRNSLLPIHNLPVEILSCIFKQLLAALSEHLESLGSQYYRRLRQAFVLGSVSSHFRHVAFGTPELWRRIRLRIPNIEAIGKASYLIQHCIALAPSLDIFVTGAPNQEVASSALDALLTPDTTQKIKSFHMLESFYPSTLWVDKFKVCSPIVLDTLEIRISSLQPLSFDIRMLTTLTRVNMISTHLLDHSIIIPPSVQYLVTHNIPEPKLLSLLSQCPNLIEWDVDVDYPDNSVQFTQPLTLHHLKSLSSSELRILMSSSCLQNLQLPSLEFLQLEFFSIEAYRLFRHVSATLTTLTINMKCREENFLYLSELRWIPFPKLKKLFIDSHCLEPLLEPLELLEGEDTNSRPQNFPILQSIVLCLPSHPRFLLKILKKSKIGRAFQYDFSRSLVYYTEYPWTPELRKGLRSIMDPRRMEVTQTGDTIYELSE